MKFFEMKVEVEALPLSNFQCVCQCQEKNVQKYKNITSCKTSWFLKYRETILFSKSARCAFRILPARGNEMFDFCGILIL